MDQVDRPGSRSPIMQQKLPNKVEEWMLRNEQSFSTTSPSKGQVESLIVYNYSQNILVTWLLLLSGL